MIMLDLTSWSDGWLWIIAAFVALYIKGICGFGNSLVFDAIMNYAADNISISPVEVVMGMPANVIMAFKERKHLDLKLCLPLTILLLIGMLPGIFLLKAGHPGSVKKVCGAVIALIALWMLISEGNRKPPARKRWLTIILGLTAGVLAGMYGIAIVLGGYISMTTEDVHSIKANLSFVFAVENIVRIIAYILAGIITLQTLERSVILIPFMVLGLFAGMFSSKFIPARAAKKLVILMLIISGAALVFM